MSAGLIWENYEMPASSVSIERLTIIRGGRRVVGDVSAALPAGRITALLGANGAGKSSLVLAMAGAIPSESGRVRRGETVLTGLSPQVIRQKGMALVPEGHRVLGDMTVEENLLVSGDTIDRASRRRGMERVYAVLPELIAHRHQRAGSLSGGQKQMVSFGQALVSGPDYIIVDELSLGLAPTVVRRLMEVLIVLRDDNIGVLLIEQFASLALKIADHALVLERGRVVFEGSAAILGEKPEILHGAYLASTTN